MVGVNNSGIVHVLINLHIVLALSLVSFAKENKRPHIIFFLADDLGWNDVGFHGMTDIPTPNIDALAADSVVLNNHYTSSLCTPSRASLLTGRYPSNIGIYEHVLLNAEPWGLPLDLKLLPEFLNEIGYDSHIVGKWHLGHHRRQYTPTYRGFQTHYGFYNGGIDFFNQESRAFNYSVFKKPDGESIYDDDVLMVGKDMVDQMKPVPNRKGKYLTDLLTNRAKRIIKRHDIKKPLFLFLSHHGVHRGNLARPMRAPDNDTKFFSHFNDRNKIHFAGTLRALDTSLGAIFTALEKKEMLKDTVLIFVSDNGAAMLDVTANFGSNWPLRGQKGLPYEGGVRTVAMVWSPRLRQKPHIKNGLFHITDWMPTLYRLAGGKVSRLGNIDGIDQMDYLKLNRSSRRKEILLSMNRILNVTSIRNERYKLLKCDDSRTERDWTILDNRRMEQKIHEPWTRSNVYEVLTRFYKNQRKDVEHMKRPLIEVTCNQNVEHKALLTGSLMLFDLNEDPCELNNIADQHPEIVEELLNRIDYWKNQAAPLVIKKFLDFKSDPKYFDGYWSTWLDSNFSNYSTPYC